MNRRIFGAAAAATLLLAGCTAPPWEVELAAPSDGVAVAAAHPTKALAAGPTGEPKPAPDLEPASKPAPAQNPEPAAEVSPEAPRTPAPPRFTNEFAEGTLERVLTAGSANLKTSYWSSLPNDQWTPAAVKPLTIQLTGERSAQVELYDVQVFAEALTTNGWVDVTSAVQQPPVTEGADITRPRSATLTTVIGQVPGDTEALRLTTVVNIVDTRGGFTVQASATTSFVTALAAGV